MEVVGNGAWRITPMRALGRGGGGIDIYRGNMVGKMIKEINNDSMEEMD
jgi:hypothetical protein